MSYKCLTCKHYTPRLTADQVVIAMREGIVVYGYCRMKKQLLFQHKVKCKLHAPRWSRVKVVE